VLADRNYLLRTDCLHLWESYIQPHLLASLEVWLFHLEEMKLLHSDVKGNFASGCMMGDSMIGIRGMTLCMTSDMDGSSAGVAIMA
jgi:hypothetical protein